MGESTLERRACTDTYTYLVGGRIEVWDKDGSSLGGGDDEYIGTWVTAGTGEQCVTFPWEGASYQAGEAHPDVYIKYLNEVRSSAGSGAIIEAVSGRRNQMGQLDFQWLGCGRRLATAGHLFQQPGPSRSGHPGVLLLARFATLALGVSRHPRFALRPRCR